MDTRPDIDTRLRRAVERLEQLRSRPGIDPLEAARLAGKIQGVKLAASYVEEDERLFGMS